MALIFSFTINHVAAAQGTSINTITPSDNLTSTLGAVDSQITNQTKTNTSKINITINTLNSKKNQTLPDPQIYRNGVPVGPVYTTIAEAIANSQSGDTIMLENGATFKEHDLTISKNLDFKVFNNGHATIDANNLGRVFIINSGVTVNFYNITFTNGISDSGGAIYNSGTLNVINCTFINNTANPVGGGAIYNEGTLNVTDSIFTNNSGYAVGGGAIWNLGTLTVNNCTFTDNHSIVFLLVWDVPISGEGGAINNEGTLNVTGSIFTNNTADGNCGGAISNSGTLNITGCTFTGNMARVIGGGAIYNEGTLNITGSNFTSNKAHGAVYGGPSTWNSDGGAIYNKGTLNVTSSTFTQNIADAVTGGAIYNSGGYANINYNRIIGNSIYEIHNYDAYGNYGYVDARFNWWGSNSRPAGIGGFGGLFDPWIILTVNANPTTINYSGNSLVTADLLHDSTYDPANPSASYHNPTNGHVPDGIPVTINTIPAWGTITNIIPTSSTTLNGKVTATYTANGQTLTTPVKIYANVDNEHTVYATININKIPTSTVVDAKHDFAGQTVDLVAHVTDTYGNVNGGQVQFTVDGVNVGTANVNNGLATFSWLIPFNWNAGSYNLVADYLGTPNIDISSDTNTLTVDKTPTSTVVDAKHDFAGQTVDLVAHVTDTYGNVNDGVVQFTVDGVNVGTANVNNGLATFSWLIPFNWNAGSYNLVADYLGTPNYLTSTDTNTLTVDKTPTSTVVDAKHDFAGQTVDLVAHVTDTYGNVNDGVVQFTVDGVNVGTANVNNGLATFSWLIPFNWNAGSYNLVADYLGTPNYLTSTDTNTLTVDKTPTSTVVDAKHNFAGQTVDLVAHVTDTYGNVNEGQVQFEVGSAIPFNVNVVNGIAEIDWLIPSNWNAGSYNLVANYLGTSNIDISTDTNTLTVDPIPTAIIVNPLSGFKGDVVDLVATLTDTYNNVPVSDKTVQFSVNNNIIGNTTTNVLGIATLPYTILQNSGIYTILAEFIQDTKYATSSNTNNLTVTHTPTNTIINALTGNKGETVNLTAALTDTLHQMTISGKTIKFLINGNLIGTAITNNNGIATLPYTIIQNGGYHYIDALFDGDSIYNSSTGGATLKVPQSNIYVTVISSNSHPKIGETIHIAFKVGNKGPDTANNVILTLKIPEGIEYVSATADTGSFTYNKNTRTIIWTIGDVPVGDPKLILNAKILHTGNYTLQPTITTATYDPNLQSNIGSITINVPNSVNPTEPVVNAETIPMQPTGTPIIPLVLGILMMAVGIMKTKKN